MKMLLAFVVTFVFAVAAMASMELCFLRGSRVDGLNRLCFYSCASGTAAITVAAYELCPLNVER